MKTWFLSSYRTERTRLRIREGDARCPIRQRGVVVPLAEDLADGGGGGDSDFAVRHGEWRSWFYIVGHEFDGG